MDVVGKSWEVQKDIEERVKHVGKGKYGRVLKMARKPSNEEYIRTVEITGLGLILIGGLGFLIYWLMVYLPGYFS
ncbi:MAG: protein translocase SEC61 complex subunit gamma [Methanomassiliicoccales archaeon]|jgi:protein transport protein SEC61 subunit gamma-like protein|nr:protein translocase SEC61 complex subunit gamma [Methanomassiliicoccales archaeon]MDD1773112.1 protein translocase SEC61 complex subunit gamma [Methanomassiliicoccales archaeon]